MADEITPKEEVIVEAPIEPISEPIQASEAPTAQIPVNEPLDIPTETEPKPVETETQADPVAETIITEPVKVEIQTEIITEPAEEIKPEHACLVPEKREELTTEGGLDVIGHFQTVEKAVQRLQTIGSEVSLFIDPDVKQIDAAKAVGAPVIELHTGCYADATDVAVQLKELERIRHAAEYAASLNIIVNAGHGLHYHNVQPIARIKELHELNIGHAIIARALFCGLKDAVRHMRQLMQEARTYVND